jgi:ribonuclease HI
VIGGFANTGNDVLFKFCGNLGSSCTNNTAEYMAFIFSLSVLNCLDIGKESTILVNTDSELLSNQINKIYKVTTPHITILNDIALSLFTKLPRIKVKHIYREYNTEADLLGEMAKKIQKNKLHLYI